MSPVSAFVRRSVISGAGLAARAHPGLATSLSNNAYRIRNSRRVDDWSASPLFLLHVPKCAGVSICSALGLPDPGHLLVSEYSAAQRAQLYGKSALICVRDPVERFHSLFEYLQRLRLEGRDTFVRTLSRFDEPSELVGAMERGEVASSYFLRPATAMVDAARDLDMRIWAVDIRDLDRGLAIVADEVGLALSPVPRLNAAAGSRASVDGALSPRLDRLFPGDRDLYQRVAGRSAVLV